MSEIVIKGLVVAGIGIGVEMDNVWKLQQIARQVEKFLLKEHSIVCDSIEVRKC